MMVSKQHVCALGTQSENQILRPHSSKTQEGSQASGYAGGFGGTNLETLI